MTPRIVVDDARCVGHGRCYTLAPTVYAPDDRGYCVVLPHGDGTPGGTEELDLVAARLGADACPERAITVAEREPPPGG